MKELGNLAIVCAKRPDVLLQVYDGRVSVHVGAGSQRATLHCAWNDDDEIRHIVHEMNFGIHRKASEAKAQALALFNTYVGGITS